MTSSIIPALDAIRMASWLARTTCCNMLTRGGFVALRSAALAPRGLIVAILLQFTA